MSSQIDWGNLLDALQRQADFSSLFFDEKQVTLRQKQELLKTFVLSLHSEATGIVEGANYKDHRLLPDSIDAQKVLYKSVDAYRYILAILNLCGIDGDQFVNALKQKDEFLHYRHSLSQRKWNGEPVVLFDMDDVLAEFRASFCEFVTKDSGVFIDPHCPEYYNVTTFKKYGLSNEYYFRTFIDKHGFLGLHPNDRYCETLRKLKDRGCWIQIVTARPEKNLTCFYDTYSWLYRHDIPADAITFAPEKFAWLADQKFYATGKFFAVDDSAKHSAEYAKHGVQVIVPQKTYNAEVSSLKNISYVPDDSDPFDAANIILESLK